MHPEAHRKAKPAEETPSGVGRPFEPSFAHRGGISNRQTPPELEIGLTRTKQTVEVISNRQ